jgi:lipopolysaccharide biosynthesis protein
MINYLAQHWNLINFIQQQIKRLITYNQTLAKADFFVECCPKVLQRLYMNVQIDAGLTGHILSTSV